MFSCRRSRHRANVEMTVPGELVDLGYLRSTCTLMYMQAQRPVGCWFARHGKHSRRRAWKSLTLPIPNTTHESYPPVRFSSSSYCVGKPWLSGFGFSNELLTAVKQHARWVKSRASFSCELFEIEMWLLVLIRMKFYRKECG